MVRTKNPYVVMKGIGHEDLDTTKCYMHNDTSQFKAVIDERNRQEADFATNPLRLTAVSEFGMFGSY